MVSRRLAGHHQFGGHRSGPSRGRAGAEGIAPRRVGEQRGYAERGAARADARGGGSPGSRGQRGWAPRRYPGLFAGVEGGARAGRQHELPLGPGGVPVLGAVFGVQVRGGGAFGLSQTRAFVRRSGSHRRPAGIDSYAYLGQGGGAGQLARRWNHVRIRGRTGSGRTPCGEDGTVCRRNGLLRRCCSRSRRNDLRLAFQ